MDNVLQHVLIVTYLYPPVENAGTRPVVQLVRYLPKFGFQPVILTTRNYGDLPDDAQTLIFRADELFGYAKRMYRAVKLRNVPAYQQADHRLLPPGGRLERWKLNYLIPDPKIIWYPSAVRRGLQALRAQPVRLLYSISPPQTSHLIALKLKQKTGLPWVADFRDGWLFEPLIPARLNSKFRRHLESHLEKQVIRSADHIVTVNPVMAADLKQRYPKAASKVSVMPNGFDRADFAGLRRRRQAPDKLRLVYTGSFSLSRSGTSITALLQSLTELHTAGSPVMEHLELVLVGNLAQVEQQAIEQSEIKRYFTLLEPVPHRQALQYQVDADLLLLVTTPAAKGISTSKLFEYLAVGRPILALTGQSVAGQIVLELEAGLVVEPDDVQGIKMALQTFHELWCAGRLAQRTDARVQQYDRQKLTEKLALRFDELLGRRQTEWGR